MRSFYAWLLKHRRIPASQAAAIRAPKAPRKLQQVLDPDEAQVLVEVPADAPLGLRDRALLELFYSSGLRLSELCALRWRDLDLAEGVVTVLGNDPMMGAPRLTLGIGFLEGGIALLPVLIGVFAFAQIM